MSLKNDIQVAMKQAMKDKAAERLECLRMMKGALLLKEKETGEPDLADAEVIAVLRAEARKRQQTAETMREVGREDAALAAEREIDVIESFLPKQLDEAALEARVRAFLADNPGLDHPGKLTGALKKELGDLADGRMLNEVCRRVLGA
jgi:uncharacterized protein